MPKSNNTRKESKDIGKHQENNDKSSKKPKKTKGENKKSLGCEIINNKAKDVKYNGKHRENNDKSSKKPKKTKGKKQALNERKIYYATFTNSKVFNQILECGYRSSDYNKTVYKAVHDLWRNYCSKAPSEILINYNTVDRISRNVIEYIKETSIILLKLFNECLLRKIDGVIDETDHYILLRGVLDTNEYCLIKIFKLLKETHKEYHKQKTYEQLTHSHALMEEQNLIRMFDCDIRAPIFITRREFVVIMSLPGNINTKQLSMKNITRANWMLLYKKALQLIIDLHSRAGMAHGNLHNCNNIFRYEGKLYFLNVSQAVALHDKHGNAYRSSDWENIRKYFSKKLGPECIQTKMPSMESLMKSYVSINNNLQGPRPKLNPDLVRLGLPNCTESFIQETVEQLQTMVNDILFDELCFTVTGNRTYTLFKARLQPENAPFHIAKNFLVKVFKRHQFANDSIQVCAENEAQNLMKMYSCGINVPKFIAKRGHIVLMALPGSNDLRDCSLKKLEVKHSHLLIIYQEVIEMMLKIYRKAKMVHGQISENSVYWYSDKPCLLNVSFALHTEHVDAKEFLRKDCEAITNFFIDKKVKYIKPVNELYEYLTTGKN